MRTFKIGDWVINTVNLDAPPLILLPKGTLLQIIYRREEDDLNYLALNGVSIYGGWFSHKFRIATLSEIPNSQLTFEF